MKESEMVKSASRTGGGPSCAPPTAQQGKVIRPFSNTTSFSGIKGAIKGTLVSDQFSSLFELMLYVSSKIMSGRCLHFMGLLPNIRMS